LLESFVGAVESLERLFVARSRIRVGALDLLSVRCLDSVLIRVRRDAEYSTGFLA
jgi:hypothetical protein